MKNFLIIKNDYFFEYFIINYLNLDNLFEYAKKK